MAYGRLHHGFEQHMVSEAPPFWWQKSDWKAWALSPVSLAYGLVSAWRMATAKRQEVDVPVICVGNFTIGGAGKTPTVMTLARAAKARGLNPGILSRGYGGSMDVTTLVDPNHHRAKDVGDEPLLLSRIAMTVISRNRIDGARKLIAEGADIIIMDDGFQSAKIAIDFALVVIDTVRGLGNGHVFPAGPVRTPMREQLRHVSALLKVGNGNAADRLIRNVARAGKPVHEASVQPVNGAEFDGVPVLAFAGIADPDKFYRSLAACGALIKERRSFGDHQHLSEDEMSDLIDAAEGQGLQLVTTAKDHVRLLGHPDLARRLADSSKVLEIDMVFDAPNAPDRMIDETIKAFRKRQLFARNKVRQ